MGVMKRIGVLLLSVCIMMGLGACGNVTTGAGQTAQSSAGQQSEEPKSSESSESDAGATEETQSEGKTVPNWREVYHCADYSEYGSLPDFDVAGKVILGGDCVIVTTDQTVTVPIMDAPVHDGVIKVSDRLLGELPVTFNSADVGSWSIAVDATNLKPVTLTSLRKTFNAHAEVCFGGSCSNPLQEFQTSFGGSSALNIAGGTTVVVRFYIAGAGDVAVIRRG